MSTASVMVLRSATVSLASGLRANQPESHCVSSQLRAWHPARSALPAKLACMPTLGSAGRYAVLAVVTVRSTAKVKSASAMVVSANGLEIAARSPLLLCLAGAAHIALLFLEMMAEVSAVLLYECDQEFEYYMTCTYDSART